MKKIAISLFIVSFSMSFASYQVMYPNQLVKFKNIPSETFTPTDPLISEWINTGVAYDCNNYTPDPSTYAYGVKFTQSAENCKIDQERSIQNRHVSSITNKISNDGVPTIEKQTLSGQSGTFEGTGTRYNYTLNVGHYINGPYHYYGYFSASYMSTHGAGFTTALSGDINSKTFRGSSIDHLMESDGNVTMRVLPDITGSMPILTINGKPCTLTGPSIYTAYDATCNFNLGNYVGQTLYIDLR